jgi:hypothetical protein
MSWGVILRGAAALGVGAGLASAVLHAGHGASEVRISGRVALDVSSADPLLILSGDGETPLAGGGALDFGTMKLDYWGKGPTPMKMVVVKNTSSARERVVMTGDLGGGILPLFGLNPGDLQAWPENGFDLAASGDEGDRVSGWLGLGFIPEPGQERVTSGVKLTTIMFSASDLTLPSLPSALDFEDPSLGNRCLLARALPLRDRHAASHGVSFSGATPGAGLAVLHRCANLDTPAGTTGDYFLVGIHDAIMANGEAPWLPEVITFSYPVHQVTVLACSCGSAIRYSLSLRGYEGPQATGEEVAAEEKATDGQWQAWRVSAPADRHMRSVTLTEPGNGWVLVVDRLEWRWAGE